MGDTSVSTRTRRRRRAVSEEEEEEEGGGGDVAVSKAVVEKGDKNASQTKRVKRMTKSKNDKGGEESAEHHTGGEVKKKVGGSTPSAIAKRLPLVTEKAMQKTPPIIPFSNPNVGASPTTFVIILCCCVVALVLALGVAAVAIITPPGLGYLLPLVEKSINDMDMDTNSTVTNLLRAVVEQRKMAVDISTISESLEYLSSRVHDIDLNISQAPAITSLPSSPESDAVDALSVTVAHMQENMNTVLQEIQSLKQFLVNMNVTTSTLSEKLESHIAKETATIDEDDSDRKCPTIDSIYPEVTNKMTAYVDDLVYGTSHGSSSSHADYALMTAGGEVVAHSGLVEHAPLPSSLWQRMKMVLGLKKVHPWASLWVLTPSSNAMASYNSPGDCLPLKKNSGYVLVRLRERITVNSVTIEHIPRSIAYDISSAPRTIKVCVYDLSLHQEKAGIRESPKREDGFELLDGNIDGIDKQCRHIGDIEYDVYGNKPSQNFVFGDHISDKTRTATHVMFNVTNNWGSEELTCMYRLRVHGTPIKNS